MASKFQAGRREGDKLRPRWDRAHWAMDANMKKAPGGLAVQLLLNWGASQLNLFVLDSLLEQSVRGKQPRHPIG